MLDIVEVSRRTGLPASALRYYEEKGLIASVGRQGLRRQFTPGVLDQLALVALGQAAGFSLDEIASMFGADGKPSIDRRVLASRADEIDLAIKRMKAMSNGLRHAAVCPARSHAECPTFQRLVKAAAKGLLQPMAAKVTPTRAAKSGTRAAARSAPSPPRGRGLG
jgi:DNA-binding transcriptional MerR regulator